MPNIDSHRPGQPSWVDLMTPDPVAARKFYGALFGWSFEVGPPESGHYAMCRIEGRSVAGMGQMPPDAPMPTAWSVYFATAGADASCARIEEHGGRIVTGPMDVMEEGRLAFCADPTGACFGVWEAKKHPGAGRVSEPGAMAWHEVNTPDAERAVAFYGGVFELEGKKMEGMSYWTLHRGGEEEMLAGVSLMDERFPAGIPAHWMTYFGVADCDASVARLGELGGRVVMPAFDTPYGRIAFVSDPFGAVFCVIRPPG